MPHLIMLALLGLAVWLLAAVFAPIREPVLLAASLVALTYSALFEPIDRILMRLGWLADMWRKRAAAATATLCLVLLLVSPILLMLLTSRSIQDSFDILYGLATRDRAAVANLAALAGDKVNAILAVYPDLPITVDAVKRLIVETFAGTSQQAILGFLFKNTGGFLAQVVLSLLLVYYFYEHGPRLIRVLLSYSPLESKQRLELKRRFRNSVLRLLNDTIGTAALKGLTMGALAWFIGGFHFFIVAAVATFVGLIPVVGYMFVWLPLASLLYHTGDHIGAISLAVASPAAAFLIQQLSLRIGTALHQQDLWMSVLLFLSLVGGVLAFGAKGLVVGPTAVVITAVLGSFWLPLYGVGKADDSSAPPDHPAS
jgi:predicted PurR-regulated permease PerM